VSSPLRPARECARTVRPLRGREREVVGLSVRRRCAQPAHAGCSLSYSDGRVIAAVSGPTFRINEDNLSELAEHVLAAASEISQRLRQAGSERSSPTYPFDRGSTARFAWISRGSASECGGRSDSEGRFARSRLPAMPGVTVGRSCEMSVAGTDDLSGALRAPSRRRAAGGGADDRVEYGRASKPSEIRTPTERPC
jgi:hypothetical protein